MLFLKIRRYILQNAKNKRYGNLYLTYDELKELRRRFESGERNGRTIKR